MRIHTGNWGTGAFGNDRVLMALVQMLAARFAQVCTVVVFVGVSACVCVCMCVYVCMCVCVFVFVRVFVYVCMSIISPLKAMIEQIQNID